jgi:hypothetical protein
MHDNLWYFSTSGCKRGDQSIHLKPKADVTLQTQELLGVFITSVVALQELKMHSAVHFDSFARIAHNLIG